MCVCVCVCNIQIPPSSIMFFGFVFNLFSIPSIYWLPSICVVGGTIPRSHINLIKNRNFFGFHIHTHTHTHTHTHQHTLFWELPEKVLLLGHLNYPKTTSDVQIYLNTIIVKKYNLCVSVYVFCKYVPNTGLNVLSIHCSHTLLSAQADFCQ